MAGYPFYYSIWTPQESDKVHQNGTIDPKFNALQGPGPQIWIKPLVFPLFWNEMTKNDIFYKVSTYSYFHIDL